MKVDLTRVAEWLCFSAIPLAHASLSFSMCFLFFGQIPSGFGKEQAMAELWPAERGLCEGDSGQNVMAGEASEWSQSGALAAAQWGAFKWWVKATMGSGHSPQGQQTVTTRFFKMSRFHHRAFLCWRKSPSLAVLEISVLHKCRRFWWNSFNYARTIFMPYFYYSVSPLTSLMCFLCGSWEINPNARAFWRSSAESHWGPQNMSGSSGNDPSEPDYRSKLVYLIQNPV